MPDWGVWTFSYRQQRGGLGLMGFRSINAGGMDSRLEDGYRGPIGGT